MKENAIILEKNNDIKINDLIEYSFNIYIVNLLFELNLIDKIEHEAIKSSIQNIDYF